MSIIKKITNFIKKIFGQKIDINVEKNTKYNIKNNKKCNISINDIGAKNEKR